MEKQPFDQTGLQQLLAGLYDLDPAARHAQARALLADPMAWICGHFELDPSQQAFLDQLPLQTLEFLGSQGSYAIANQLPITLSKSGDPKDEGKLFTPKSSFWVAPDAQGRPVPKGAMAIEVVYGQPAEAPSS